MDPAGLPRTEVRHPGRLERVRGAALSFGPGGALVLVVPRHGEWPGLDSGPVVGRRGYVVHAAVGDTVHDAVPLTPLPRLRGTGEAEPVAEHLLDVPHHPDDVRPWNATDRPPEPAVSPFPTTRSATCPSRRPSRT